MKAINNTTGEEIKRGDIVVDFRGDEWMFAYPIRARGSDKFGARSGKVMASSTADGKQREFYDNVFGITVLDE